MLLKGKDQKHAVETWLNSIMYAGVQMDTLFSGNCILWIFPYLDNLQKYHPLISCFCMPRYLTLNCSDIALFHTLIHDSTVDQFSGESNPVILPLDENQVSFCIYTLTTFPINIRTYDLIDNLTFNCLFVCLFLFCFVNN